ncbi:MAG: DUF4126 domain-containing protein [Candidatus Methylacidiphilales bacterium]|nr:DUF4126 domain-containing protein [Candidatus Methylacidiphilales bacterium]
MEVFFGICLGLGLAAASGMRVTVPALVLAIAAKSGHVTLAEHFQWLATTPALICLGVAALLEIAGYFIPWVDHLLGSIATPAAVIAGTLVAASTMGHLDPWLQWTLAVIAGGGAAGTVQLGTVAARALSLFTTGGIANPVVSLLEFLGSLLLSVLSVLLPLLGLILASMVLLVLCGAILLWRTRRVQAH